MYVIEVFMYYVRMYVNMNVCYMKCVQMCMTLHICMHCKSICACYLSMYEWSVYIRMYICIGMYLNYFI